ncbi:PA14 domain-containing protein [Thermovibrio sp.]
MYTPVLNVTPRSFREGFPGITDRFEWFAIDYKGKIYVPQDREFTFYLLSDDGAKLIIDGKTVIDNDGIHLPTEKSATVRPSKGIHTVEVRYFQGPRYEVALVLSHLKNGRKVPFDIRDFALVQVEEGNYQVNLTLSSGILFDFNSYALKPEAIKVLDEVVG